MKKYIFKEIQISLRTVRVCFIWAMTCSHYPSSFLLEPQLRMVEALLWASVSKNTGHMILSATSLGQEFPPRRLASLISSGSMLQKLYSMQAQLKGPEFPPILSS